MVFEEKITYLDDVICEVRDGGGNKLPLVVGNIPQWLNLLDARRLPEMGDL